MAIIGAAAGVVVAVLILVLVLLKVKHRKGHAARPSQEQEIGSVVNVQVGTAADVPMGMPVHAAASSSSSKPTLAEMVELLKQHCGVDGDNFSDVVHKAAHQLGIDPAGKSLMEIAMMCMQQLGLVA